MITKKDRWKNNQYSTNWNLLLFLWRILKFKNYFAIIKYGLIDFKFTKIDLYQYIFVVLYLFLYHVYNKNAMDKRYYVSFYFAKINYKKNCEK